MTDLLKPIPTVSFPTITEWEIMENCDELVDMLGYSKNNGVFNIVIKPKYYRMGIPGAPSSVWVRKTVADKLINVAKKLSAHTNGIGQLCLYDGWRPWVVQNRLYNKYYSDLKLKEPELSEEELHKKTGFFVSKPSEDCMKPFLHNTGGAIDLTIAYNGVELNMGSKFDDFSNKSWTNHFEEYTEDVEVRDNRRLLYNLMISEGFTNLPSEWWHYDYGNKFWAYFTGNISVYKGVMIKDVPCFPLF